MTSEEFNRLLNTDLSHPLLPMQPNRLVSALWDVVQAGGEPAVAALKRTCRYYQLRDEREFDADYT